MENVHELLLIIDVSTKAATFPANTLKLVDDLLASIGFRKEMSTVVRPGQAFSVTYDGPSTDKVEIEKLLKPIVQIDGIDLSVDIEESVRFP